MSKVPNTAETFDDCVGKRDEEVAPVTLFDDEPAIPQSEEEAWDQFNWEQTWKGMPSYQSDDQEAVKKLIVNFSSEEDFNEFCRKLDYEGISMKTRSAFYPERKSNNMNILRWIDEEDA